MYKRALALTVCGVLFFLSAAVSGDSKTWFSTGGDWLDGANWNPAGVPDVGDDVYITGNQDFQVSLLGQASVKSLTLGGNAGRQTLLLQGAVLSLSDGGTVSQFGVLEVASGSILGSGELVVDGIAKFHDLNTKILSSIGLTIHGTMTLDSGGLELDDGAVLTIGSEGVLNITTKVGIVNNDKTAASINNEGTIFVQPGEPANYLSAFSASVVNSGTLSVLLGKLQINNGGQWSGSLYVENGASVQLISGNHTFTADSSIAGNGTLFVTNSAVTDLRGDVEIAFFELDGGGAMILADSDKGVTFKQLSLKNGELLGQTAVVDSLIWEGGSMYIDTVNVDNLQVHGSLARTITGTNLVVGTVASFADDTNIILYDDAALIVSEDATMVLDTKVYFLCGINDTTSTVQIEGQLHIKYLEGIEFTCTTLVQQTGSLYVEIGALSIQAPFELYGNLSVSAGSNVDLSVGGPAHFGSSIDGAGYLTCSACALTLEGRVDVGGIMFTGGQIVFQQGQDVLPYPPHVGVFNQSRSSFLQLVNNAEVPLNLTIDKLVFTGGDIRSNLNNLLGVYSYLIVREEATFSGGSPVVAHDVAYVNYGVTRFLGDQPAELHGLNVFVNAENGTFSVDGKAVFTQSDQDQGFLSQFENYGLLEVGLASNASFVLNLNNYGSVAVREQASLSLEKGRYIQTKPTAVTTLYGGMLNSETDINILEGKITGFGTIGANVLLKGLLFASTELDGGGEQQVDATPLRIKGSLLQRAPGKIGVALGVDNSTGVVGLNGQLIIENLYQLWGGSLGIEDIVFDIYPDAVPPDAPLVFMTYKGRDGVAQYDTVQGANINATLGFAVNIGDTSVELDSAPNPVIVQISPQNGPTSGGTRVTISGDYFVKSDTLAVRFGGDASVPVVEWVDADIVVLSPPGTGKAQGVCVVIDGRGCWSPESSWNYDAPLVSGVAAASKPTSGGNTITINGANFGEDVSVADVSIGSSKCTIVGITHESITCVAPAGVGANIAMQVAVNGQTVQSSYSYDAPAISSTSPSSAHTRGGELLLLIGSNFGEASSASVSVDSHACGNVTFIKLAGPLQAISCTLPALPHPATVEIVVTVASQKSAPVKFVVNGDGKNSGGGGGGGSPGNLAHQKWGVYVVFAAILLVLLILGLVLGFGAGKRAERNQSGFKPLN